MYNNILFTISSLLSIILCANSLIIPEELPSILSLIYSNIPPIKKGTDSRVGFGFRLGEHADFQILLELGPQKNTRPLGNEDAAPSKRQTPHLNYNIVQLLQKPNNPAPETITDTEGGKWLQTWQQNMKKKKPIIDFIVPSNESYEGAGEIRASDVIPDDNSNSSVQQQSNETSVAENNDSSSQVEPQKSVVQEK